MTRSQGCPAESALPARFDAGEPEVLAHVQGCPRCRALIAQHRAFLENEANPAPTPAQLAAADAALAAALEREMSGGRAPQQVTASPRSLADPPRASWWQALFAPALRPAWGFAAVLVVAGGLYATLRPVERAEVRGDATQAEVVTTLAPVAGDGVVTLAWEPVAGADGYDVVLLATDLSELGAPLHVREPRLELRRDALPAGVTSGAKLLWQVTARIGERELSHSVAAECVAP